jgi:hypothetical protein
VLHDAGSELRAAIGEGEWAVTGPLAVTSTPSGIDVVFVETPHRLHLGLQGSEFTATWETVPLHAPALSTLRKPVRD